MHVDDIRPQFRKMFAERRCESITLRANSPEYLWNNWRPCAQIFLREVIADSGNIDLTVLRYLLSKPSTRVKKPSRATRN